MKKRKNLRIELVTCTGGKNYENLFHIASAKKKPSYHEMNELNKKKFY